MAAVLLVDGDGLLRQALLGAATAVFLVYFARRSETPGIQVLCAVVIASAGEVVLSLGWGLYTYRHALIPLYVPPGHGLFYLLASESARQPAMQRWSGRITTGVLLFGSLVAAISLAAAGDTWGCLWWIGALLLVQTSKNKLLLSACFTYTILLEWAGTAIGNWRWAAEVPFLRLHSANPPAGVGILYILLDLLVVLASSRLVPPAFGRLYRRPVAAVDPASS